MTSLPLDNSRKPMTPVMWLVCVIAVIGFAFDTYELLMLPLIVRPALLELGNVQAGTPEFASWLGRLFYLPAICGGIFGLLGGYLTDLLGRRRVLTWSIILYAGSAFLAGFSTNLTMLLVLRCTTFIGVCVEFVAAVAWLAELFPEPKQRERVLGFTQAFSSLGGVMVAFANGYALSLAQQLPAIHLPAFLRFLGAEQAGYIANAQWRYTLMSGLIPAIPLLLIRPFLPESPTWRIKRASGMLRRPSLGELFSPMFRRTTIVTTIMFACSLGAAFGAIQQMPQIVAAVPQVQQRIKAEIAGAPEVAVDQADVGADDERTGHHRAGRPRPRHRIGQARRSTIARPRVKKISGQIIQESATEVTKIQEFGGLVGRIILAILALFILSRRKLIRVFQIPGMILLPLVFAYAATHSLDMLKVGMFFAGLVTVAQLSFWGNYLPTVYPVHLRGTGESFAANVGGRMIGTIFAWVTATIAAAHVDPKGTPAEAAVHWAFAAAGVGCAVYVVGFIFSFFLPESKPRTGMKASHAITRNGQLWSRSSAVGETCGED